MASHFETLTVSFDAAELDLLDAAAKSAGMSTANYVRNAALITAKSTRGSSYTPQQLSRIHRQAKTRGKVWTEDELRARSLPLYWSKEWLETQLDQGATYASLATQLGCRQDSISGHALLVHGIRHHRKLTPHDEQAAQAVLDGGGTVAAAAQTIDVTPGTISAHFPAPEPRLGRLSRERIAAISWPANIDQITEVVGNRSTARSWALGLVTRGLLEHVATGVFNLPGNPMDRSLLRPPTGSTPRLGTVSHQRIASITWPATIRQIADQCFSGTYRAASSWIYFLVRAGKLTKVGYGLYAVSSSPDLVRPSYDGVDWSLTNREIGSQLGVTEQAVWQARKRLGAPPPPHAPKVKRADIRKLLDEGLTATEIQQRLGLKAATFWTHLSRMRRAGEPIPLSVNQHLPPAVGRQVIQQLVDLARGGREWPTIDELMATTGATRWTVGQWRRTAKARLAEERAEGL